MAAKQPAETPAGAAPMPLFAAIRLLVSYLSPGRRRQMLPLTILTLMGSFAELATIAAILPFLAVVADPENSPVVVAIRPFLDSLGITTPTQVIWATAIAFSIAAVSAMLVRLLILRQTFRFVFGVSYELSMELYNRILHEPYAVHMGRSSGKVLSGIAKCQNVAVNVLVPLMQGLSAAVISVFILGALVLVSPMMALLAGGGFALIYGAVMLAARGRIRHNSVVTAEAQTKRMKCVQEGLGGIRDIIIDQSQPIFLENFQTIQQTYRDAKAANALYATAPRFVVEGSGMVLVAGIVILIVTREGGLNGAIPTLGALAIGAQRLLPLLQQIYNGWAQTAGHAQALYDLVELMGNTDDALRRQKKAVDPLPFNSEIRLSGVAFRYSTSLPDVLSDIDLTIPKGARVGFVGKTGSGKSTLVDIILGLLEPTHGKMSVDGVPIDADTRAAWRANIAHVPQSIYLADASVAQNIAFGVRQQDIDYARVEQAARDADIHDVVMDMPERYDTRVGERGVRLSGGQRQRLGIARALYKQAPILVLDEATSALDTETESQVMQAVDRLDRSLTILMISHRMTILRTFDRVVRLSKGNIVEEAPPAAEEPSPQAEAAKS